MGHPVDVAADIAKIIHHTSNYITQTILTKDGVIVKVGDLSKMKAGVVNVSKHRKETNSKLQDKLLAVKLAFRMHTYLKSSK